MSRKSYVVENNLDFFSELAKSLSTEETEGLQKEEKDNGKQLKEEKDDGKQLKEGKSENEIEYCLITSEPLTSTHVKLPCGHKFNYLPLFHDLFNHKSKLNRMEGPSTYLNSNQIRCPYCRSKQVFLLPYYEEFKLPKVIGINANMNTSCSVSLYNTRIPCEYVLTDAINNNKCPLHSKPSQVVQSKYYCYDHYKAILKQLTDELKAQKQKIKDDLKKEKQQAKLALKEELKKQVQEAKEAAKATKVSKDAKTTSTKTTKKTSTSGLIIGENGEKEDEEKQIIVDEEENIVISQTAGCVQVLKTGANKGQPCNMPIYQECYCKRHFNLNHKDKTA